MPRNSRTGSSVSPIRQPGEPGDQLAEQPAERATVGLNVSLPVELHRQLRIAAATRGLSVKAAVIAALTDWTAAEQ
jgi:predicted HicB family RNase H-like nuclease